MDNETEMIHHEMQGTRKSMSHKVDRLESEVGHKVEQATEAVSDAYESVKDTVSDTIGAVKQTFDLNYQAEHHPWLLVGGAVAVGFLGHCLLVPSSQRSRNRQHFRHAPPRPSTQRPEPASQHPGEESSGGMWNQIGEGIDYVKNLGISTAVGVLKQVFSNATEGESHHA